MKRKTKIIIEILAAVMLIAMLSAGIFSSSAVSDDPADSYEYQEAEYEDYGIDLWFDYSFRKTFTGDTTYNGKDTFSIYMAKNEIESAQFVLYSDDTYNGMSATISQFTDGNGHTVDAQIYYEFYETCTNLDATSVLGSTASTTFIREGEIPDPIAPLDNVGTFKLVGGKSQAFLIRAKTLEGSSAGWYSAQLDIKNSDNEVVKTATVYLKVWDFVISDKTQLKSAFIMSDNRTYGGSYQIFYDYLLENRLNACDIPGGRPSMANSYIYNDRVAAVRISSNGLGSSNNGYLEGGTGGYWAMYNEFADDPRFESVKDKFWFYPGDEPTSLEQQTAIGNSGADTVDTVNSRGQSIQEQWPGAKVVIPFHENHPYPYNYYHNNLNTYADYQVQDGFQAMLDTDYVSVICPQIYAFTPSSVLSAAGYQGNEGKVRNLSCTISGMYTRTSIATRDWANGYMNWEALFGDAYDRLQSNLATGADNLEVWSYSAGWNKSYTYCNHLIENTGLQTKMLFWQMYQNDVTGYLYYGTINWDEYSGYYDSTPTGAKTNVRWFNNKHTYANPNHSIYGNGVLFYGRDMGYVRGTDYVGSLRVEILRDGVEEYQMMYQLAELKGDVEAKSYVNSVSNNVADYLSMPNYNRSAWSSDMDDYEVMETARRNLGAALEEATANVCEHQYDNGAVTKPAGCITVGTRTYTCTLCGAEKEEVIPMLHDTDSNFTVESVTAATCSLEGSKIIRCNVCGYRRTVKSPSNHYNPEMWTYDSISDSRHKIYCSVCDLELANVTHVTLLDKTPATCTEDGLKCLKCVCGYTVNEEVIPATGHDFVDGVCTVCGETEEPEVTVTYGDLNGDGKVTAADLNVLAKALVGTVSLSDAQATAADVSGDGKATATDTNLINKYLSGTLSAFPVELQ